MKDRIALSATLALAVLLAACAPQAAPATQAPATQAPAAQAQPTEALPLVDDYGSGGGDVATMTTSVEVSDQAIQNGTVTVSKIQAAVDGWIVIHTDAEGKPGPVIGYAPVSAGESSDVGVTIDESQATPMMFAMLHVDEGVKGTYEFPGADAPAKDGDAVVMTAFNQSEAMMIAPSVVAEDQRIVEDSVTVASVYMTVPGWLVIHTEVDGKPGPVIGHTALPQGESKDIKVEIDESDATSTLFAMLHVDEGVIGTYEFPGADAPVKDGDMIVMVPFSTEYQY
ncbi:MAG TPA: hypothetical protein VJK02_17520 [Anaerolineales bacterium]|nr:hypothetical protein [Anaerolineales bacterium]